jgi:hypothetical protein
MKLPQSVEMERGGLVSQIIGHLDCDPLADIGLDSGNWPFAIDADNRTRESIRSSSHPPNAEGVRLICYYRLAKSHGSGKKK